MSFKVEYNILIIEDNPGDYALIEDFLLSEIKVLNVKHAKSYSEAEMILATKSYQFDIILLDISLPDKTGLPLINKIVEASQNIPVIVLTGHGDFKFGVKSLSLGISDYILKDSLTPLVLYKSIVYSIERKKSTSALEESEKRHSDLFHLSPQPMWVYVIDTLQFEDVNEAAIKHYGYTREEFLSMTVRDIRLKEDFKLIEDTITNNLVPEDYNSAQINRHKKKNGEIIYAEIYSNTIVYKGKKAKIIFANDITERQNHINAIEQQNKKLREIAWIQSHVVRAPLARLMGLIDLFNNHQNTSQDKCRIMEYVLTSASELDATIKEISNKVYDES
jgi:PAS domain S-box-containing protein